MTIEDIRKNNKTVFDKIDADFAPNERDKRYSDAYANILYESEKKEKSARSYVTPDKKTVIGVIIAIVVLIIFGTDYLLEIATGIDDNKICTIIASIAYLAAGIIAIVSISVCATRYSRWKKLNKQVAFLRNYMVNDESMYSAYNRRLESEKFCAELSALATAPARKSSSKSGTNSSSPSSQNSQSGGYFSSPSDRVNYKDGVRDWGYSENGRLYDSNNNQVGYVDGNDRVYDNNHDAVGYFDDNGTYHNY